MARWGNVLYTTWKMTRLRYLPCIILSSWYKHLLSMILSINMVLTFTSTWTLWHCISDWVCVRILKTMCSIVLCSSNIIRARSSSTWLTKIIIIHKLIMSIIMYIKHIIKSRWPIYHNKFELIKLRTWFLFTSSWLFS